MNVKEFREFIAAIPIIYDDFDLTVEGCDCYPNPIGEYQIGKDYILLSTDATD
jgi:hypothetical protein